MGAPAAAAAPLTGTFRITAGTCSPAPSGSYFRMIQPAGTTAGPFLANGDSACSDTTYTLLSPGTDGGLRTGAFQGPPTPAFAGGNTGDALAGRITKPTPFFGVDFSIVTAATDPQTGTADPLPRIEANGAALSGQITAWAAQWNGQSFNQGSPKPDGTSPGITSGPTGTYNATTRAFTLDWTSLIVGGPFNSFTGLWHIVGTFAPTGSTPTPPGDGGGGGGGTGGGGGAVPAKPLKLGRTVVGKDGRVRVELRCRTSKIGRCRGTISAALVAASKAKAKPSTRGTASFSIAPLKKATVKLRLRKADARLIRRLSRRKLAKRRIKLVTTTRAGAVRVKQTAYVAVRRSR
ncbi:MAG: hypothetical protein JW895_08940 [Thermoleophilaceae bacterium]|nr:hypothetical protein [Thermoleophilaceae bacterium]